MKKLLGILCFSYLTNANDELFSVEVLEHGAGDEFPISGAVIKAHYTGRLAANDKVFDSSLERGKPFEFELGKGRVIKCWDEGFA